MGIVVTIDAVDAGTQMVIETTFPSRDAMEQVVSMGMEEGMVEALGQIDELLRASAGTSPPRSRA
jgi:hypothetical protein